MSDTAQGDLSHTRPSRASLSLTEGDLIIGRGGRSAIGTIVERRSGLLRLVHLPDGFGPDKLCRAITPVLEELPSGLRRSLTWDQGTEMARHDQLAHLFSDGIFFAYPASPWQRGSNENINGLVEWSPEVGHSIVRSPTPTSLGATRR